MNTVFLATVLGWYMVILGLLVLVKHNYVKSAIEDVLAQRGLYFVLAVITIILGLLLVASHNIWVMGWPVIITVLSWLILIGGLFRVFFAETAHNMMRRFLNRPKKIKIVGVISLIIGILLLLQVFHFHYLTSFGL